MGGVLTTTLAGTYVLTVDVTVLGTNATPQTVFFAVFGTGHVQVPGATLTSVLEAPNDVANISLSILVTLDAGDTLQVESTNISTMNVGSANISLHRIDL